MDLPGLPFDRASILAFAPQSGAWVYRILDGDGAVLYIGASMEPRARLLAHLRNDTAPDGAVVRLQACRTTTAMHRAEREAIATEQPRLPCGAARRHRAWKAQAR